MRLNLKDFRQSQGLYQSDMAAILGLNQSNVSRAELKGWFELSYPQLQTLYEKFGKETVEKFMSEDPSVSVSASNNTNKGSGTQNNGYFGADSTAMDIIRRQTDVLAELASKQSQQTDRLLALLEKISEKL